jgi:hypothetical protein
MIREFEMSDTGLMQEGHFEDFSDGKQQEKRG